MCDLVRERERERKEVCLSEQTASQFGREEGKKVEKLSLTPYNYVGKKMVILYQHAHTYACIILIFIRMNLN